MAFSPLVLAVYGVAMMGAPAPHSVAVSAQDAMACVDLDRLDGALKRLIPEANGVALDLHVTQHSDAAPVEITLSLRGRDSSTAPLLERNISVAVHDCPTSADLIAFMVERRLRGLPAALWQAPSAEPINPTPPELAGRGWLEVGGSIGLNTLTGTGHLTLGGSFAWASGGYFRVGAHGNIASPASIGDGSARLWAAGLVVGGGWRGGIGGHWTMGPRAALSGGVHLGLGDGFDEDRLSVLPWLEASVGLDIRAPWGGTVALMADIPLMVARLIEDGGVGQWTEANIRLRLMVGVDLP